MNPLDVLRHVDPNVLLVVLDTVRARNVSAYGYHRETTPFLDSFAAERATLYEQARAPASRSLDSHVSIFTGLAVEEHGVTTTADKLEPGHTIFEELRDDGYDTGVFTENSWLTDVDAGLKDAFDTIEGPRNVPFPDGLDPTSFVVEHGQGAYLSFLKDALKSDAPTKAVLNGLAVKLGSDYPTLLPGDTSTPGEQYVDLFLKWIDSRSGPWAACLNLMDAHHPYEPQSTYDLWGDDQLRDLQDDIEDVKWEFNGGQRQWWQRSALEALYDGAIRQLDAQLERLVTTLERRDQLDDTLLVVLSDHGEGFGEPSHIRPDTYVASHSVGVHEVLTHVPLILSAPGQEQSHRVSEVCSITEFPDVVRAARGGTLDEDGFCSSDPVVATGHGLDEPVQERASRYCDNLWPFTATARAVWTGNGTDVRKSITWRDRATARVCHDAITSYAIEDGDPARVVESAFERLENQQVTTDSRGLEDLNEDAYDHLEDLGYV
jgi:arylsulfatase